MMALTSSFCFACASFIYRRFSVKNGALWMNAFKASMALGFFTVSVLWRDVYHHIPSFEVTLLLLLSGMLGLNIGDYCLLSSYKRIGSGRTLMLTSLNPVFLSLAGWLLFGEVLLAAHWLAIIFLSLCLLFLGMEDFHLKKGFKLSAFAFAMTAAILDAVGILITRGAFQMDAALDSQFANLIRLIGALAGFLLIHFFYQNIHMIGKWKALGPQDRSLAVFSTFLGTFFALSLWILALQKGRLGIVAAMGGFGPLFATGVECFRQKKWPSRFLLCAAVSFLLGFALIVKTL